MKNQLFEDLKKEFDIELQEILKGYCNAIWDVYEKTDVGDFEKTINKFLEILQSKANQLYFIDRRFYWYDKNEYAIDSIYEALFNLLKVTNWENIKTENDVNYIIDFEKINDFKEGKTDELEILLLLYPSDFIRIYEYFLTKIEH